MFVFDSEVWCDTCGEIFQSMLVFKGMAPKNIEDVDSYDSAEGPHGAEVVTGGEAREWERGHEPDTRDRFAEAMNY